MSAPFILAIESATIQVGCAIGSASAGVIASTYSARGRRHGEALVPQIQFVAEQAGVPLSSIEAVAVDVGPGLYTGLRVGVTTAKALAHALGIKVIPVTSLDAIAHRVAGAEDFVVAIDARRGEVFHATYSHDSEGTRVATLPAVGAPGAVAGALSAARSSVRVFGDGALTYAAEFRAAGVEPAIDGPRHPGPDAILELAATDPTVAVEQSAVAPLYLRRPDAVAKWEVAT